jgi:hypothetical protein
MSKLPTWDDQVKAAKQKAVVQADAGPSADQMLMQHQIDMLLRIERILATTSGRVRFIEFMLGALFLFFILGGIIGFLIAIAASIKTSP